LGLLNPTQDVCDDVKLNIVGLIQRTPENGIEWRTPSIIKYQNLYRYIHRKVSTHTKHNEKTKACQLVLERKIITFLGLIKVVNSST
jgi:hypothetical protein